MGYKFKNICQNIKNIFMIKPYYTKKENRKTKDNTKNNFESQINKKHIT